MKMRTHAAGPKGSIQDPLFLWAILPGITLMSHQQHRWKFVFQVLSRTPEPCLESTVSSLPQACVSN